MRTRTFARRLGSVVLLFVFSCSLEHGQVLVGTATAASCNDVATLNGAIDQYNSLPACARGTQEAVKLALLEKIVSMQDELAGCSGIRFGTPTNEIRARIVKFKEVNRRICSGQEQVEKLRQFQADLDDVIKGHEEKAAEYEAKARAFEKLAGLVGKAEDLAKSTDVNDLRKAASHYEAAASVAESAGLNDFAKNFREVAAKTKKKIESMSKKKATAKTKSRVTSSKCRDALAHRDKLSRLGTDTSPLDKVLQEQGCE